MSIHIETMRKSAVTERILFVAVLVLVSVLGLGLVTTTTAAVPPLRLVNADASSDREISDADLRTCDTEMELVMIDPTVIVHDGPDPVVPETIRNATCADGSNPGYYVSVPDGPTPDKLIIWLSDGLICGTEEGCSTGICERTSFTEEEALNNCTGDEIDYSRLTSRKLFKDAEPELSSLELSRCRMVETPCSSNEWNETLTGESVMCGDDDTFGDFIRVFVPHCTADWFLGRGSTPDPNSPRFLGANVFDAVIEDLVDSLNIGPDSPNPLSKVVLGGTGGGGLGALHNFRRMKARLEPGVALAIIDSSWYVNVERFSYQEEYDGEFRNTLDAYLRNNSLDWMQTAAFDKACVDEYGKNTFTSRRCLYARDVLQARETPDSVPVGFTAANISSLVLYSEPILMIQSQYDFAWLDRLQILDDADTLIPQRYENDERTYINALRGYIESFGSNLRASIFDVQRVLGRDDFSNVRFYTSSCMQHGYVAPTSLNVFSTRLERIGRSGELAYNRTGDTWGKLQIRDESVENAIKNWVNSNGAMDDHEFELCGSALCNPSCPSNVRSFVLLDIWSSCSQNLVVAYAYFVIAAFWFVFIVASIAVCRFRNKTNFYWEKVKAEEEEEQGVISTNTAGAGAATGAATGAAAGAGAAAGGGHEAKLRKEAGQELLKEASTSNKMLHLMCKNLSYWAAPRNRGDSHYQILKDVSVHFPPGMVHAMMGPSGSGKSTLLDIIALTRDSGFMTGIHYINGVASHQSRASFLREWLRHNVSYVRQQDNLFPLLTVREHLTHAAWLMLPEYMPDEMKLRRIWQVIKLMELDGCADTVCGDGGVMVEGGISGGQRRRVSVATQLLRLPAAMLLDEPTSGLDSTNALLLVKTMHTLAHQGNLNIILTIHQPRKEIYAFLDTLKVLVRGRVVFAGKPSEAFDHFSFDSTVNIGDEILDRLALESGDEIERLTRKYEDGPLGKQMEYEMSQEIALDFNPELAQMLRQTLIFNALAEGRWSWTESSSVPTLMYVLLSRTIKRGGFDIHKTGGLSILGGFLVGIVFLNSDSFTSKTALSYLSCATMTFLQGTFLGDRYWGEKFMYDFERDAGTARPWISFIISMYVRLGVAASLEALAFALPLYFLSGMNTEPGRLENYLLIMVLISITTASQYLLVEIHWMQPDDKRTAALVNMVLLSMSALFNGFIIQLSDLPFYLSWVPTVMLAYWGFVALLINELKGFSFDCDRTALECASRTGDNIVRELGYADRDIYICMFVLLIITGLALTLGVLDFYFNYVYKQGESLKRKETRVTAEKTRKWLAQARNLRGGGGAAAGGEFDDESSVLTSQDNPRRTQHEGGTDTSRNNNGSFKSPTLAKSPSSPQVATPASGGSQTTIGKVLEKGTSQAAVLKRQGSSATPKMSKEQSKRGGGLLKKQDSSGSMSGGAGASPPRPKPGGLSPFAEGEGEEESSFKGGDNSADEGQDEGHDGDNLLTRRQCCSPDTKFVQIFLSRFALLLFFILDFFLTSFVCTDPRANRGGNLGTALSGGDDLTSVAEDGSDDDVFTDRASVSSVLGGFSEINLDLESANFTFVFINAGTLIFYTLQYFVQLLFLFPRSPDGSLQCCNRLVLLDILGLCTQALDVAMMLVLLVTANQITNVMALVIVIRMVRLLRLASFWFKVSDFHRLRAQAFSVLKEYALQNYDPNFADDDGFGLEGETDENGDFVPPSMVSPESPLSAQTQDYGNYGASKSSSMAVSPSVPAEPPIPPPSPQFSASSGSAAAGAAAGAGAGATVTPSVSSRVSQPKQEQQQQQQQPQQPPQGGSSTNPPAPPRRAGGGGGFLIKTGDTSGKGTGAAAPSAPSHASKPKPAPPSRPQLPASMAAGFDVFGGGLDASSSGRLTGVRRSQAAGAKSGGLTGPKSGGLTGPKSGGLTGPQSGRVGGSLVSRGQKPAVPGRNIGSRSAAGGGGGKPNVPGRPAPPSGNKPVVPPRGFDMPLYQALQQQQRRQVQGNQFADDIDTNEV